MEEGRGARASGQRGRRAAAPRAQANTQASKQVAAAPLERGRGSASKEASKAGKRTGCSSSYFGSCGLASSSTAPARARVSVTGILRTVLVRLSRFCGLWGRGGGRKCGGGQRRALHCSPSLPSRAQPAHTSAHTRASARALEPPRTVPMESDTSSVANSHDREGKETLKLMRRSSPWGERSTMRSVRVSTDR